MSSKTKIKEQDIKATTVVWERGREHSLYCNQKVIPIDEDEVLSGGIGDIDAIKKIQLNIRQRNLSQQQQPPPPSPSPTSSVAIVAEQYKQQMGNNW